ncbi:hypothetical protein ROTAS13_03572 [Roseomonas sp. TAS13]|nr:hypothetical protein ROTAS13_03572 [Roseomonas sp. TAS13]
MERPEFLGRDSHPRLDGISRRRWQGGREEGGTSPLPRRRQQGNLAALERHHVPGEEGIGLAPTAQEGGTPGGLAVGLAVHRGDAGVVAQGVHCLGLDPVQMQPHRGIPERPVQRVDHAQHAVGAADLAAADAADAEQGSLRGIRQSVLYVAFCALCDTSWADGDDMEGAIAEADWESLARNMLRAEIMRRGISYARLVEALAAIGVEDTEGAIKNKVSRGRFSFMFSLQAMVAIGAEWMQVPGAACLLQGEGLGNGGTQALAKARKDPAA